jgi:hypothetical protein
MLIFNLFKLDNWFKILLIYTIYLFYFILKGQENSKLLLFFSW